MPTMISRGRGRRTINEINMVPFIDVMLVLLIIFMVTAPLIQPSMISLPSIGKAAHQPDQVVQIVIGKGDALSIKGKSGNSNPTSVTSLVASLKREKLDENTAVVIAADKGVKYESVVKIMDTLQRAGVQRVGLSVQLTNN